MLKQVLTDRQNIQQIESVINELERDFQAVQGLILTEDDLKCQLYQRLSTIPAFNGDSPTHEQSIRANKIHCEVSWFDKAGKLAIKPDLTILEPKNLSIIRHLGERAQLPSKGFHFRGRSIIFELKFCRYKTGITPHFHKKIEKDWNKIKELYHRLDVPGSRDKIFTFFVIFSKMDKSCPEFQDFLTENQSGNHHRIFYKTGKVMP